MEDVGGARERRPGGDVPVRQCRVPDDGGPDVPVPQRLRHRLRDHGHRRQPEIRRRTQARQRRHDCQRQPGLNGCRNAGPLLAGQGLPGQAATVGGTSRGGGFPHRAFRFGSGPRLRPCQPGTLRATAPAQGEPHGREPCGGPVPIPAAARSPGKSALPLEGPVQAAQEGAAPDAVPNADFERLKGIMQARQEPERPPLQLNALHPSNWFSDSHPNNAQGLRILPFQVKLRNRNGTILGKSSCPCGFVAQLTWG